VSIINDGNFLIFVIYILVFFSHLKTFFHVLAIVTTAGKSTPVYGNRHIFKECGN